MGYRSDVKLITTKAGWERLDNAVKQAMDITEATEADAFWLTDSRFFVIGDSYVLAEWDDIKWYEGDTEVGALMRELYSMAKDSVAFKFMRVGEDYEDVERLEGMDEGLADYDKLPSLWLERKIEVEY